MDKWNELRTAYHVASAGTVTEAAHALGIHRATVIRHIDTLEEALGTKLFQRHLRGYTPTEAGLDVLRVAKATDEQFEQLAGRVKGREAAVSGELIVTSVEIVAPFLVRAVREFGARNPATTVRYVVSGRMLELEYGEAHVAVRSGPRPEHPDNVVRPFMAVRSGLYVHRDYIARRGRPTEQDLEGHDFIGPEDSASKIPFMRWLAQQVPPERVTFRSANHRISFQALKLGLGLGFAPTFVADQCPDLVEIIAPKPEWDVPFWLVTHVDLHRSAKVQAFLQVLRAELPDVSGS